MDRATLFQYALLGIFGVLGVAGLIFFATFTSRPSDTGVVIQPMVIWGPPLGTGDYQGKLREMSDKNELFGKITYVERNPVTFYKDVMEAIATGKAPDIIVVDQTLLLQMRNKLQPISYTTMSLSTFRSMFVEGGEVFALSDGIYAFPFLVDPLVLYWNRDLFTNAAVAQVPETWDSVVELVPKLRKVGTGGDLSQGAIAFGQYDNVFHAKDILSALLLQSGVRVSYFDEGGNIRADLTNDVTENAIPDRALQFFVDFANPGLTAVYGWNKTFDRSREAFAANRVAMYVGPISDVQALKDMNPNLNFDVVQLPQSRRTNQVTFGTFYGLAVLKGTTNPYAAHAVQVLSGADAAPVWGEVSGLMTVLRSALKSDPRNAFSDTSVRSAIIARAWLEPGSKSETDAIFQHMVNDLISSRETSAKNVLDRSQAELNTLLQPYNEHEL